jgi:hypothetical protein
MSLFTARLPYADFNVKMQVSGYQGNCISILNLLIGSFKSEKAVGVRTVEEFGYGPPLAGAATRLNF